MFNANSIVVQSMIKNGQFGTMDPQMYYNGTPSVVTYNNYDYGQTNMIPLNFMNPPQQNGYVFQPVSGYNGQPQYNYYDPYGQQQQTQQWPYGYNYQVFPQQSVYGKYNPYMTQQQIQNIELEKLKCKCKIAGGCFGIEYTDQQLNEMLIPSNPYKEMTDNEREIFLHDSMVKKINNLFYQPQQESRAEITKRCLRDLSNNMHKELDNHSMFEFFENDLWKFQREYWIEEHIGPATNMRDLSRLYSSQDYNDLLKLHQSSNPFIAQLMDNHRYDNNLDDMEISSIPVLNGQERNRNLMEGKVPEFISSPEIQKQRHEWTNTILAQIYNKGGGQNVQSISN